MKKILGLLCMATLMLSSIHNANAAPRNNIQYPKGIWLYQSQDGGVYTSDWYAYPLTKNGNNLEIGVSPQGKQVGWEIFRIDCENKGYTDVYKYGDYMGIEQYLAEFGDNRRPMVTKLFKTFCN